MQDAFSRTRKLLGADAMEKLSACRVAIFGIGGVGGHALEALVRSGVGAVDLIDNDKVCLTNLNRQIIATRSTIGCDKVEVAAERVREINPDCTVRTYPTFFLPETADAFDFSQYDYVVDAIDTVTGKIALVQKAVAAGVPIICSMGAGNKLDPTRFRVSDLSKTHTDPLAKVMRRKLGELGIKKLKVVWSDEPPMKPIPDAEPEETGRRETPGSIAFVPSVAGLILAGEVVRDLIAKEKPTKGEETL